MIHLQNSQYAVTYQLACTLLIVMDEGVQICIFTNRSIHWRMKLSILKNIGSDALAYALTATLPQVSSTTMAGAISSVSTNEEEATAAGWGGFLTYSDQSCSNFVADVADVPSLTNRIGLGVVHSYKEKGFFGPGPCITVP